MKKGIECFVEGNTGLFKQRGQLPATARVVTDTDGLLHFFLFEVPRQRTVKPKRRGRAWSLLACLPFFFLGGCGTASASNWDAIYLEQVHLVATDDVYVHAPFSFEPGEDWLLWLSSSRKGAGIATNNLKVTNVLLLFDDRPPLDQTIDLATMPLWVSYEYGGEVRTYISHRVSGTLTLSSRQGGLQAEIEATFSDPVLGQGEQRVKLKIELAPGSRQDWAHLSSAESSLQALPQSSCIEKEAAIGLIPLEWLAEPYASVWVPSRRNLLGGVDLAVYHPEGALIENPALKKRIAQELDDLLGGWFSRDLTPHIRLYDSLVSQATKERYNAGGMTIHWDEPQEAFYYLSFESPPWQVQAVGEAGVFHAVFLGHLLSEQESLGPGGHPLVRPVGDIGPLLATAAPHLDLLKLTDKTAEYSGSVFDLFLEGPVYQVRGGVRWNVTADGDSRQGDQAYFYGVRINLTEVGSK